MKFGADGRLLIATRGLRGFIDGLVAVTLAAHLAALHNDATRIGFIVTGMLLGSAAMTLYVGVRASHVARRTLLLAGAVLMIATGIAFTLASSFPFILAIGIIGTINPTSGDVSVVQPIEQSLLPNAVSLAQRGPLFARYTFVGTACAAAGLLAAAIPDKLGISLRVSFATYALVGVLILYLYSRLSPAIEPRSSVPPRPLGPSRLIVTRLAALFGLDSFAGGFAAQSLLALWLFRRFDFTLTHAGMVLSMTGILAAASGFVAVRLERRIGPVRTMVFTHLPAQFFLIGAAFMPNATLAVACLLARSALASMDVPVRNAFVMSVVTEGERAAAASVTNVPRSLAAALSPFVAGWMLDQTTFGYPLIAAGVLKIVYDLLLLYMFDEVKTVA